MTLPAAQPFRWRRALLGGVVIALGVTWWLFSRTRTPADGYDWLAMHVFNKHLYREALLAGRIPWWNPWVEFGRPFLADIETASFYPPNLIFLLPPEWALPASVFVHVVLIVCGCVWLGRWVGLSWMTALIAGATYALAAPLSGRLQAGQLQVFCVLAHAPLLLAAMCWLTEAPGRRRAAVVAVVMASALLAGSPPFFWAAVIVFLPFVGWLLMSDRGGSRWRCFAWLAAAGGVGALLAAVQLLPFLELLREGNRPLHDPGFASSGAPPAISLLSLVIPAGDHWRFYWETCLYAGPLAAVGLLVAPWAWRHGAGRVWLIAAGVGLVLAFGEHAGVTSLLARTLPGFAAVRLPSRYAFASGWCLAMVAIVYWPAMAARFSPARRRLIGGSLALAQIGTLAWAVDRQAHLNAIEALPAVETRIVTHLRSLARDAHRDETPLRVALPGDAVRANSGVLYGFSNLRGFANPALDRVWSALVESGAMPGSAIDRAFEPDSVALQSRERLGHWGVEFGWDMKAGAFFFSSPETPRALADFHGAIVPSASAARQSWLAAPGLDTVWLEGPAGVALPAAPTDAAAIPKKILHYAPERISVAWGEAREGWLVLAEPWYPGWRAFVGGEWVECVPANGWMRAVRVPAKQAEVEFQFRSRSARWGAAISLLAAAAIIAALCWPDWRAVFPSHPTS